MILLRWWYCNICKSICDIITLSEATKHEINHIDKSNAKKHREKVNTRKYLEEVNARQMQMCVDTYS